MSQQQTMWTAARFWITKGLSLARLTLEQHVPGHRRGDPATSSAAASQGYEEELQAAREEAIQEMCGRAQQKGANAVVGVDVDYEILGSDNGMLMVSVSGTAVVI